MSGGRSRLFMKPLELNSWSLAEQVSAISLSKRPGKQIKKMPWEHTGGHIRSAYSRMASSKRFCRCQALRSLSLSQDYMSNKHLRGKKWSGFHCRWERTKWVNTSMKCSNIYFRELWAFRFALKKTRSCTLSLITLRSIQRSSDELCGL